MKNLIIAAFVMLSASFVNAQTAPATAPAATTTTAAPVKVKRTYTKRVQTAPAAATTATGTTQTAPTAATTTAPVKAKRVRKPKAEMTPATGAATTAPTTTAPAAGKMATKSNSTYVPKSNSTYVPKSLGKDAKGHDILLGPNGGQYYIGSTGKKEYLKKSAKMKVN